MSEKSRFWIFSASLSREPNSPVLRVCFFYANCLSVLSLQCRIVSRDLDLGVRERGNERRIVFF